MKLITGLLCVLFASTTLAAESPESKILGSVDLRPSWTLKSGSLGTENVFEAGYQFNKQVAVSYYQGLLTNLDSSSDQVSGANVKADLGFLRVGVKDIAELGNSGVKFSYSGRVYAPTAGWAADSGMVTTVRNYLNLSKEVIPETLVLTVSELPILHVFTKPGSDNYANPVFENRVYLIANVNLAKGLSLEIPLMFHQTRHADYQAGATNNDTWSFVLWTYPELGYALTENTTIGLAYYSGNLINADGFETGVAQTFFAMSL